MYDLLNVIAGAMVLLYNLLHYKEKQRLLGGVSQKSAKFFAARQSRLLGAAGFWTVLEIVLITAAQQISALYLNGAFGDLMNTGANYFGTLFFAPLLVLLLCILLKIDFPEQMDLITPAYPLGLIFIKLACFSAKCCRGIACSYGIYNPATTLTEFPVQLLEAAVALVLFLLFVRFSEKLRRGTVFPVYLMTYSATRFFTEFLRCEPKTFYGLRRYQVICLVGVLVGALEYFLVCRYHVSVQKKKGAEKARKSCS